MKKIDLKPKRKGFWLKKEVERKIRCTGLTLYELIDTPHAFELGVYHFLEPVHTFKHRVRTVKRVTKERILYVIRTTKRLVSEIV